MGTLLSKCVAVAEIQHVSNGFLPSFTDPDGNEVVSWEYVLNNSGLLNR